VKREEGEEEKRQGVPDVARSGQDLTDLRGGGWSARRTAQAAGIREEGESEGGGGKKANNLPASP
jgi:hypothetical protein